MRAREAGAKGAKKVGRYRVGALTGVLRTNRPLASRSLAPSQPSLPRPLPFCHALLALSPFSPAQLIAAVGGVELDFAEYPFVANGASAADKEKAGVIETAHTKAAKELGLEGCGLPIIVHGDLKFHQSFACQNYIASIGPKFPNLNPQQQAIDDMFMVTCALAPPTQSACIHVSDLPTERCPIRPHTHARTHTRAHVHTCTRLYPSPTTRALRRVPGAPRAPLLAHFPRS